MFLSEEERMPYYTKIDGRTALGKRTAEGLLRLKDGLDRAGIPERRVDGTLMLATWNLREFGDGKFGLRDTEALYYIAEVISHFDLVAVQEVLEDFSSLTSLRGLLGSWWDVLMTDVTQGKSGNRERLVFLYDSRKIRFGGLAGEIVLPPVEGADGQRLAADQLARTPYLAGFQAGWFRFTICTTHVLYGKEVAEDPRREKEIHDLATFLAARAGEKHAWAKNMILLGDFNIFKPSDVTFKAITSAGFKIPEQIQHLPSNALRDKHYDQIAFIAPQLQDNLELCTAGIFNFYDQVFRDTDEAVYAGVMGERYEQSAAGVPRDARGRTTYYKQWRTFRMSDHLPMWIELNTDFSRAYLEQKRQHEMAPTPAPDLVPA